MKTLMRILSLTLAACLMLCLCACNQGGNDTTTKATDNTTQSSEPITTTEKVDTTEKPEVKEPDYTVTVVDENNAPIAGAWVQLCLDACVPATTNEQGVAEFFLEKADYKVSIMMMPEGYTYATEETEWHFADGENALTIVLKVAE